MFCCGNTIMKTRLNKYLILFSLLVYQPNVSKAYSVLSHEALIDAAWDHYIVPLLKQKFPSLNDSLLKEAHAYAYGGAVSSDMGYYPFGSKLFTNLVHYVRSGDFVTALMNEASNADEYAFALGSLCHYYADVYGHRLGVNVSVPIAYPKDRKKFGSTVTYEQDETAHKRVEFSFDVSETAKGNYASQAYHDFIGFKVADSVLERAFFKTYNLHLTDVFPNFSRAVGTFRWSVKNFFPVLTRAAWASKRSAIRKHDPTITAKRFRYKMKTANYNKEFGKDRERPGVFSFLFAALIKILPKIGPLAPLKFKAPSPEVEKIFIQSFDTVQLHYSNAVEVLRSRKPTLELNDKDFDTGLNTQPGEYHLTDKTYSDLLLKLACNTEPVKPALKQNILTFFKNGEAVSNEKKSKKEEIAVAISQLKSR
jgi:hypothetical protein